MIKKLLWLLLVIPTMAFGQLADDTKTKSGNFADSGSWSDGPTLPKKVERPGLTARSDGLYCIMGINTTNVFKYDGINWVETIGLPEPIYACTAATLNNDIYMIPEDTETPALYKFDGLAWTKLPSLGYTVFNPGLLTFSNSVYILGGGYSGAYFTNVFRYTP